MTELMIKTKGNSSPGGKPRVYFTCHPEDFLRSYGRICEDIFEFSDCAICCAEDMSEEIPEEIQTVDLERMNLFVIPVSLRLLTTKNRAMDFDFAFAKKNHIPVLPILLEKGIAEVYRREDKFGSLQYLDINSKDSTAIDYKEKLSRYLSSTLISGELEELIRSAFNAYIFLSYRKKDRRYANELMRLIHENPVCRDIAIWYDEFLTPGENFNETIRHALKKSDLFALLVTPNLINEENYVRSTEYPMAQSENKNILPAEMVATDTEELKRQFSGIPESVNARDKAAFGERLTKAVCSLSLKENNNDANHVFLIGLAYLAGIDVEINNARAVELITKAAEAQLPEAMETLNKMYRDGIGVERNLRTALEWREKIAEYNLKEKGEEHPDTLLSMQQLAVACSEMGDNKKAAEINEKVYACYLASKGEEDPDTVTALSELGRLYEELGDYEKAFELDTKAYELHSRILGEEDPDTLLTLSNLGSVLRHTGAYEQALELNQKIYEVYLKNFGEKDIQTLMVMNNIAALWEDLGKYKQSFELREKTYKLCCEVLGEEQPETMTALGNLASSYDKLGKFKRSLELFQKQYEVCCRIFGEEHPDTLSALHNLANEWGNLGKMGRACELFQKAYELRSRILGEDHPDTITALGNAANGLMKTGNYKEALEILEKVYEQSCRTYGEKHSNTLTALSNMGTVWSFLGDLEKSIELEKKVYDMSAETMGKDHPETLMSLFSLTVYYANSGHYEEAVETGEPLYEICCRELGKKHQHTKMLLDYLIYSCEKAGKMVKLMKYRKMR